MIAYVDSSVLLRLALRQPNPLQKFSSITRGISSRLIKAESLRTLDRLFAMNSLGKKIRRERPLLFLGRSISLNSFPSIRSWMPWVILWG